MAYWTVQGLIDECMTVTAYCHNPRCHHKVLDLVAIRSKLGPDAPAMSDDLTPKLRCEVCGGRAVGLIYSPGKESAGRTNPYIKAKGG